jgi:formamidopyrimidine-DNA glycosylase
MPELPEVETVKRQIKEKILGLKILKTEVLTPKIINLPKEDFIRNTQKKSFKDVRRRAKILILELSDSSCLLVHLKLSGHLIFHNTGTSLHSKFAHIILYLSDGAKLVFDDFRKFGYVKFIKNKKDLENLFRAENFGPEPFDADFTKEKFKTLISKKPKSPIKTLLMNQRIIAGLGNVYTQEICFYTKINPKRQIKTLTEKEINDLYRGILEILKAAIKSRGNSVDSYLDVHGRKGEFQNYLKVYGREGKPCERCETKIKKIWMAGRGTSFCPKCQK